jgi:uncharacterized damage-inducible protein DinB
MNEIGRAFLDDARSFLRTEYLPKMEKCLERLSDSQIWWRPNEESNSIGNLLLHLEGNARQWIISGVGGAPDNRVRDSEFEERRELTREELLGRLRVTLSEVDEVLAQVDARSLLELKRIQGLDVSVLHAIFHVVEHFSMHTGQVIHITKMLGSGDMRFYNFDAGLPRTNWNP